MDAIFAFRIVWLFVNQVKGVGGMITCHEPVCVVLCLIAETGTPSLLEQRFEIKTENVCVLTQRHPCCPPPRYLKIR